MLTPLSVCATKQFEKACMGSDNVCFVSENIMRMITWTQLQSHQGH